jgi:N-acetylneuraminate synthase
MNETASIQPIQIAGRAIGPGLPVYVVAELSANHHQQLDEALALVRAAQESGADAVKLQTYTPDTLTLDCRREEFRISSGTIWDGRYLYDLYAEAFTPWEWHARLKQEAESLGLHFFSTPFDSSAVEFLDQLDVPAFKIASFELVDLPLLAEVARRGKPVIMSTGMSSREELDEAVAALRAAGCRELALLKCTSAYPAPAEEMNLRAMPALAETYRTPVGLSDHTLTPTAVIAAVALGASIVEKHLTISRGKPGPDSAFSLEPHEFRTMVDAIRTAEQSLGRAAFEPGPSESRSRGFRRSLFVVADMAAGEVFGPENVRSIRPAHGLPPKHLPAILGRRAACAISRGTPLAWDLVAD